MLIPFSLELRDITQETEYVMNLDPRDLSVFSLEFDFGCRSGTTDL